MANVAELIKKFCEENSDEYSFYYNYSGMNMNDNQCVGIVTYNDALKTIIQLCDFLRDNDISSAKNALGTVAYDNLGQTIIVYFPSIAAETSYELVHVPSITTEKKKSCENYCEICNFWVNRDEYDYGTCNCKDTPTYGVKTIAFHKCTMN